MLWWYLTLIWWRGTTAISSTNNSAPPWKCPEISQQPTVECTCDMPHTLRCTGDKTAMKIIGNTLKSLQYTTVSLLDCTVQNVSLLSEPLLEGVALHGLVISSGEIKEIKSGVFSMLASPLQALGLPNNKLSNVPIDALISLPELDRLDLSGNRMKSLNSTSFKGLRNLSFVDLSDNLLNKISPNTFTVLPQLKILRLRGNKLTLSILSRLERSSTLEELDLSENQLIGPLETKTLSNKMPRLKDLYLSHNGISSIKIGALQCCNALQTLKLQHNQIDVIEDHAFTYIGNLINLDISYNRIVAVSGNSLAHLNKLQYLDLKHNFLRALTPDLVLPLKCLKNLKLDDNDISIIAGDALKSNWNFEHFTLADNPLNCDCTLKEFALWLNRSLLNDEDKSTFVCTTPPSLENGLLFQIPVENLLCNEDDDDDENGSFKEKIVLKSFRFDGNRIELIWYFQEELNPFKCDALFIYEEVGFNEVLIESLPVKCSSRPLPQSSQRFQSNQLSDLNQFNQLHQLSHELSNLDQLSDSTQLGELPHSSRLGQISDLNQWPHSSQLPRSSQSDHMSDSSQLGQLSDPNTLNITLPKTQLTYGNNYRYCIVLLESSYGQDDVSIILGCSDVIPLIKNVNELIINMKAYIRADKIIVEAKVVNDDKNCAINIKILDKKNEIVSENNVECSSPRCAFKIVESGPYKACVHFKNSTKCLTVFYDNYRVPNVVFFLGIFLVLTVFSMLIWGLKRAVFRRKIVRNDSMSFLPPDFENGVQHGGYVKLQATTKL